MCATSTRGTEAVWALPVPEDRRAATPVPASAGAEPGPPAPYQAGVWPLGGNGVAATTAGSGRGSGSIVIGCSCRGYPAAGVDLPLLMAWYRHGTSPAAGAGASTATRMVMWQPNPPASADTRTVRALRIARWQLRPGRDRRLHLGEGQGRGRRFRDRLRQGGGPLGGAGQCRLNGIAVILEGTPLSTACHLVRVPWLPVPVPASRIIPGPSGWAGPSPPPAPVRCQETYGTGSHRSQSEE